MHSFAQTPRQFAQNTDGSSRFWHCENDCLQLFRTTTTKSMNTTSHKQLRDEYKDHVTTKTTNTSRFSRCNARFVLFLIRSCRWLIFPVVGFLDF